MTRLVDATWPDVDAARRPVLVVPLGSLEQHGPHLPLDTDAAIATAVAVRVEARRPDVGLGPTIPLGASGEHADFPGTLSIGTTALATLVVEVVRHASRDWGAVLVVNGHGGNADALAEAADTCRSEGRGLAVVHLGLPGMDAHAGRSETSMMLAIDPDRVHLDRAVAGATDPARDLLPRLRVEGVRAVSPTGVLGDPAGATAAEGRHLLDRLVVRVLSVLPYQPVEDDDPDHGGRNRTA